MAQWRHRLFPLVFLLSLPASSAPRTPVCASCHRAIYDSYRLTGMGRSFYRPSPQNMGELPSPSNPFFHAPSQSYFQMLQRDGQYFQRRYQLDPQGRPFNTLEKRIDYVMGSGNHARAYLSRDPSGRLFELPLGWYSLNGGYFAMSPGYDSPNHDHFRRPISFDCMFCHNAYPATSGDALYNEPLPEGIDCARCHGPGARHVQLASSSAPRPQIRAAITNPARLAPARQLELCMACHLETTSFPLPNALVRYNRHPFSFTPGEPLENYIINFDHAPNQGRAAKFEIVNAAYRLRQSACFLRSQGKLLCTSCHNPHSVPRASDAILHYDQACRRCHDPHPAPQSNCASCHMPKRRTEDVVHSLATDHLIQRHKPAADLLAPLAERHESAPPHAYRGPVVLYYPPTLPATPDNELYLAVAQVKQNSNLEQGAAQLAAAIAQHRPARAEFYLDLAQALDKLNRPAEALANYRLALRRAPASEPALRLLAVALRRNNKPAESLPLLRQATQLDPAQPKAWHELALTLQALNRPTQAAAALEKALALDPDFHEALNNLALLRLQLNDPARAEAALRHAILIKPNEPAPHANLAQLLAQTNRAPEAQTHFETALQLRPQDPLTRYNFALLLGRTARYSQALAQLQAALAADPNFTPARTLLDKLTPPR